MGPLFEESVARPMRIFDICVQINVGQTNHPDKQMKEYIIT